MNINRLVVQSRKIHRLCVWFMIVFGLAMLISGMKLKYPNILFFIDPRLAVTLHSTVATFFAIVLCIMMVTGLILKIHPGLQKFFNRISKSKQA